MYLGGWSAFEGGWCIISEDVGLVNDCEVDGFL